MTDDQVAGAEGMLNVGRYQELDQLLDQFELDIAANNRQSDSLALDLPAYSALKTVVQRARAGDVLKRMQLQSVQSIPWPAGYQTNLTEVGTPFDDLVKTFRRKESNGEHPSSVFADANANNNLVDSLLAQFNKMTAA